MDTDLLKCENTNNTVNIYTKPEYWDKCTIKYNDEWFARIIEDEAFQKKYAEVIYDIDKAKIIDYYSGTMETPFATTHIREMSTGLKTLLNILYLKERPNEKEQHLVFIGECGENVVDRIFRNIAGSEISVFSQDIKATKNWNLLYKINDVEVKDPIHYIRLWTEGVKSEVRI